MISEKKNVHSRAMKKKLVGFDLVHLLYGKLISKIWYVFERHGKHVHIELYDQHVHIEFFR
jgi:hypothetical protein